MIGNYVLASIPLATWAPIPPGWHDVCPQISTWSKNAKDSGNWSKLAADDSQWTKLPKDVKDSIKCGENR